MHSFIPKGVCARKINFEVQTGKVTKVDFIGGCSGNLTGLCNLVEGMPVDDVVNKLKGIRCGNKSTSCPDQLAKALEKSLPQD